MTRWKSLAVIARREMACRESLWKFGEGKWPVEKVCRSLAESNWLFLHVVDTCSGWKPIDVVRLFIGYDALIQQFDEARQLNPKLSKPIFTYSLKLVTGWIGRNKKQCSKSKNWNSSSRSETHSASSRKRDFGYQLFFTYSRVKTGAE